ncbi:MAG: ribosomal RNA small subunit methyltransferase A [Phycisphaerales bacterium]|nr:ribosomal RNA small subunit methyltransferase A [Phycisphaerales bacterium]
MQTLTEIKTLLAARGLAPKKSLGQNFLHDHNLIRRLVSESGVGPGDLVLEVGPGTGALTVCLLEAGCSVVACEMDDGLAGLLRDTLGDAIVLVHGDCLESKRRLNAEVREVLGGRPFTLVANLPYQDAGPLMMRLSLDHPECRGQYVTIQREVGQRLRAAPGSKDYGELTVIVQAFHEVRRIATLPPGCFWPQPKVVSEMVGMPRRGQPLTDDGAALERLCDRLFAQRRKQLGTVLGREIAWPEGVEATQRPEELDVARLAVLARVVEGAR